MKTFCEELDQIFTDLPKPVIRAIMSKTLSNFPFYFRSVTEIQEYAANSLESCSDLAERESSMELIQQIMESEDVFL